MTRWLGVAIATMSPLTGFGAGYVLTTTRSTHAETRHEEHPVAPHCVNGHLPSYDGAHCTDWTVVETAATHEFHPDPFTH